MPGKVKLDAVLFRAHGMASCGLLCEVVDNTKAHARALLTSRSLESRLPALAKIFTSSCLQMCCMNFYKTVGARIWDALQALVPGVTEGWCQSGSASADPRVPMASARQQCLLRRVWLLQFRGGRAESLQCLRGGRPHPCSPRLPGSRHACETNWNRYKLLGAAGVVAAPRKTHWAFGSRPEGRYCRRLSGS